ncbi:MAG: hypothetical protein DRR08_08605 [Candidatus Parabeggiatoa sp. nov. 2]|nr:MAG: hypothetical protein B6247_02005 [Beggiatoa sp. 4572_84]RKZ61519.1 MAG: hypothetical protein DRR08_08605 [Gammaproteobacteria bacterium]
MKQVVKNEPMAPKTRRGCESLYMKKPLVKNEPMAPKTRRGCESLYMKPVVSFCYPFGVM